MDDVALEKHYRIKEIAEQWGFGYMTVLRMFQDEPGVLRSGSEETRFGRKRITLSVPESVMIRVHQRRSGR